MANDATLIIDAEYGSNLENLASNIETILSNAEKHKLKIDIDMGHLKDQMSKITDVLGDSFSKAGGTGAKASKSASKNVKKNYSGLINQYNKSERELQKAMLAAEKAGADLEKRQNRKYKAGYVWTSKSGKNDALAKNLNAQAKENAYMWEKIKQAGLENDERIVRGTERRAADLNLHETKKAFKQEEQIIKDRWKFMSDIDKNYAKGKSSAHYEDGSLVGAGEAETKRATELENAYNGLIQSKEKYGKQSERYARLTALNTTEQEKYNIAMEKLVPTQTAVQSSIEKTSDFLNNSTASAYGQTSANREAIVNNLKELQNLSNDYDKLKENPAELGRKYNDLTGNIERNTKAIVEGGEASSTFGSKFGAAFKKYAQYFGVSRIILSATRAMKQMATESINVESAMNRIQIVTGASDAEMSSFYETASSQAQELGKSITDVAGSIETFSRLGYSLKDASELSKYATIMSNVGDVDVSAATTGITSIIKGYNMDASDAEHVSDVLVNVGKKYAISAEELMQAFERGGAALSASGTDFEKSAALFAATNASLQNAQTTGTMWKTVSARIRGAKSELEEMGEDTSDLAEGFSKNREELEALTGVDIMKNETEYKDLYTIFTELAHVWDDINGDPARARVAEILGGTRQLSGIMSTINNIKDAEGAYKDAMDSAGVSARSNEKYMETTAASLGKLKATFQDFSSDFMSSSFLKGAVDTGNTLLTIIDKIASAIGGGKMAAGIGTIAAAIIQIRGASKDIAKAGQVKSVANVLSNAFPKLSNSLKNMRSAYSAAKNYGQGDIGASLSAIRSLPTTLKAIGVIGAGIAAYKIFDTVNSGWTRAQESASNAREEFEKANKELEESKEQRTSQLSQAKDIAAKYDIDVSGVDQVDSVIEKIQSSDKGITLVDQAELSKLSTANSQLEANLRIQQSIADAKKKAAEDEAEAASKAQKSYWEQIKGGHEGGLFGTLSALGEYNRNKAAANALEGVKKKGGKQASYWSGGLGISVPITGKQRAAAEDALLYKGDSIYYVGATNKDLAKGSIDSLKAQKESLKELEKEIKKTGKPTQAQQASFKDYTDSIAESSANAADYVEMLNSELDVLSKDNSEYARKYTADAKKIIKEYRQLDMSREEKEKDNLDTFFDGSATANATKKYLKDALKISKEDKKALKEFKKAGIDTSQTKFGNIDLNNRGVLEWDNHTLKRYSDQLKSWGAKMSRGDISTVFGGSENFGGVEIAFSPILQTDDGPELLSKQTVTDYISGIISKAKKDGAGKWSTEDLLRLDAKGMVVDGKKISGIIADVGETAIKTGEAMHYLGEDGAIAQDKAARLEKALSRMGLTLSDLGVDSIKDLISYLGDASNLTNDLGKQVDNYRKTAGDVAKALESENQDKEWGSIQSAYKTAKDMLKEGKTGTDDFQVMAQYFSPKNIEALAKKAGKTGSEVADVYEKEFRARMKTADRWFGVEEGKATDNFIEDMQNAGFFNKDLDEMGHWKLDPTKKFKNTEQVAKEFKMSAQSVEAMMKSLEAYGYKFDGVAKSGELLDSYTQKLNSLKEAYNSMDEGAGKEHIGSLISGFEGEYNRFQSDLSSLSEEQVVRIKFEYDLAQLRKDIEDAKRKARGEEGGGTQETKTNIINSQSAYIEGQMQDLGLNQKGVKLPVEFQASLENTEDLYNQLQNAKGDKALKIKAEIENEHDFQMEVLDMFSEQDVTVNAKTDPKEINKQFNELQPEITARANVEEGPIKRLMGDLGLLEDKNVNVKATTSGASLLDTIKDKIFSIPESKSVQVSATTSGESLLDSLKQKIASITGKVVSVGAKIFGLAPVNGSAYAGRTTSFAEGSWGTKNSGTALGGELGTELLVRDGRWYTIGDNGAEFFKYKKDDIIFNADQTEQLFKKGKITYGNTRGIAYAQGTAFHKGPKNSGSTSPKTGSGGSSKDKKSKKKAKTAMEKFQAWFDKLFDWIEIRLDRQQKRIEKAIHNAERLSKAGLADKAATQYRSAISAQHTQMANAQQAEFRYDKQAEAVLTKAMNTKNKSGKNKGKALLSKSQAATIRARVANGTIDISSYSKNLQEIIKDYQQWYDKAREAGEKAQEMSESIVDSYKTIADSYKEASEARMSLAKTRSGNAATASAKNDYLVSAAEELNKQTQADRDAIAGIQNEMGANGQAAKSVANFGGAAITKAQLKTSGKVNGKKLTKAQIKANKETNKKNAEKTAAAASVAEQAKSYARSGQSIPSGIMDKLASYVNQGFLSTAFYSACLNYNSVRANGPAAIAEMQRQLEEDEANAVAERISIGSEMVENVEDEQQRNINRLELAGANYAAMEDALGKQRDAIRAAIQRNKELGFWAEDTPELLEKENDVLDLENKIAQLAYDKIESDLDLLDSIAAYNKSLADLKEAQSKDLAASDYIKQIDDNNKKIAEYQKQASKAYSDYTKAMADPTGGWKGKMADEYLKLYNDALENVNSLRISNEELKDSLRDDVYWRTFERAHDKAQRLLDVVSEIAELISEDMYFRDGNLTSFGAAQIANLTKQYELAREEVQNYSNDIRNLNYLYDQGEYEAEEYKEKLAELQSGLLDSAKNMKGYIDDIISMYKDLDQAELDSLFKLIDKRNDALNAKKEYYDYDKTIRGKTKDIQELTAQIAALEGVNTAEAKAQRAKLQEQLSEAQEDLEDTERDHYFSMMQDALSDMKDTLQEQFDDKWEYLSQDLTNIIKLIAAANDLATTNADRIERTLTDLLSFYGINAGETGVDEAYKRHAAGSRRIRSGHIGLSSERGNEIIVTKNGIISHFNPGDGVVPADLTERLYNLAQSVKPGSSLGRPNIGKISPSSGITINQNYDSMLNIEGSADAATVSDLKRMSKDLLEKSYDYTSKRIQHDYTRTGGLRRA